MFAGPPFYTGGIAPMQHDQITREGLVGWAAGLFEGEGSLLISSQSKNGTTYRYAAAVLVTTDQDVLERFRDVVGAGKIHGPYTVKSGNKPFWRWQITGQRRVGDFLDLVEPFFGVRRGERAREVREFFKTIRPQGLTVCRNGHEYTAENTLWSRNGSRMKRRCRACERGWARERLGIPPERFRI